MICNGTTKDLPWSGNVTSDLLSQLVLKKTDIRQSQIKK